MKTLNSSPKKRTDLIMLSQLSLQTSSNTGLDRHSTCWYYCIWP